MKHVLWIHPKDDSELIRPVLYDNLGKAFCSLYNTSIVVERADAFHEMWFNAVFQDWNLLCRKACDYMAAFVFTEPFAYGFYQHNLPGGGIGFIHYANEQEIPVYLYQDGELKLVTRVEEVTYQKQGKRRMLDRKRFALYTEEK